MTQGVQDLIKAIVEGDSTDIESAFNAEMATRISTKLDDMRVSVAQSMFKTEEVEEDEAELTEEQVDEILDLISEEDMVEIEAITEEQIEEASYSEIGRAHV